MEKKASLKTVKLDKLEEGFNKPKLSGFSGKVFGVIKLILGLLLLPFIYSTSISFLDEFRVVDKLLQNIFWAGVISFLAFYLFIWEPAIIYAKGQRLMELLFSFFKPLVRVAPYLLPVYALVLFIFYDVLSLISKSPQLLYYFIFLFGFSIGLHLVFGAKSLRVKQEDFLKSNYIFGFSFVYVLNLALVSFIFSLLFEKFSFVNFSNNSYQVASKIISAVFKQLFLT